ncbi:MAG: hypothetical protein ACK4NS_12765 [Saprospiraceae bacterium]
MASVIWKSNVQFDQVVAELESHTQVFLQDVQLPEADRALFNAYSRLLQYLQQRVSAGSPVGLALAQSYERVLEEASKDPILAAMPEGALANLLPTLIESLQDIPEYVPVEIH